MSWYFANCKIFWLNSWCPSDTIWQHKFWSTLAQVMTYCLMGGLVTFTLWHSQEVIFIIALCLAIIHLRLQLHLPGANELMLITFLKFYNLSSVTVVLIFHLTWTQCNLADLSSFSSQSAEFPHDLVSHYEWSSGHQKEARNHDNREHVLYSSQHVACWWPSNIYCLNIYRHSDDPDGVLCLCVTGICQLVFNTINLTGIWRTNCIQYK